MKGRLLQATLRALDRMSKSVARATPGQAPHLTIGQRGEEDAYFFLRRQGYIMVARNYRSPRRHGEVDIIGWEGETLCFIEVKTRTSRAVQPAHAAVDHAKKQDIGSVAVEYLKNVKGSPPVRFDVVSVQYDRGLPRPEITLFRNAFSPRGRQ